MGTFTKPDITHEESGLQQNDRIVPAREPSLSYDENGKLLQANDLGLDRSESEDDAMKDAMIAARGNRRDDPQNDNFVKDKNDPSFGKIGKH